ncbi:DUF2304 domain-containing protein [Oryzobacter sp. R7]|uniref:DUF2304 domain-containing protein n=1 Tax=Oryzobacter faecalis TaxID=3388656 RepID=UPI00398D2622
MTDDNYVLGLLGGLVVLGLSLELVRRRHVRGRLALGWMVVGIGAVVLAVYPAGLYWLADVLGVRVPLNLVLFVGVLFLLVITMQLANEVGRLEAKTRRLAEEIAILTAGPGAPKDSGTPPD